MSARKRKRKRRRSGGSQEQPLRPGDLVAVCDSWHSDVMPGQLATVVDETSGGFFVSVTAFFGDALRPHVRSPLPETRQVFFKATQLRRVEP